MTKWRKLGPLDLISSPMLFGVRKSDVHEENSDDISLEERFAIVLSAGGISVAVTNERELEDSRTLVAV